MRYGLTVAVQIVVIGPSGSGKSAIGEAVAARLGVPFWDADDLHSPSNIEKMSKGIPLVDEDRMPWLALVGQRISEQGAVVMACSALTRQYREQILAQAPEVTFVELRSSEQALAQRMSEREHFMPPALLRSQLSAWESLAEDEPGFAVANTEAIPLVADRIVALLS